MSATRSAVGGTGAAVPPADPSAGDVPLGAGGEEPPVRPGHAPSLLEIAQQLIEDVRGAVQARVHLFALEARRAGLALTMMAVYAVLAALLALTAWLCGWGLAIALAVAAGAPLALMLVIALASSALAVWLLLKMARAEAQHLLFPATVRQLAPRHSPAGAPLGPSPAEPPGVSPAR